MRILYDGEIFSGQAYGGINTYFLNLLSRFPNSFDANVLISDSSLAAFPRFPRVKYDYIQSSKLWPKTIGKWHDHCSYKRRLRNLSADIIHPTYYSLLTGISVEKIRGPIVVTVWDMIHELYAQHYDPDGTKSAAKKKAIMAASAIICISENTKKDLMTIYKVPESKIWVTLLAPGIVMPALNENSAGAEGSSYFLYVGGRKYHKNFTGLLNAFSRVVSSIPDVSLCVVGRPFQEHELKQIYALGLTGRVINKGGVCDEDLATLYSRSLALVYPSLYEGFGIPPLEAMACGSVAIVANRSSIPEVVGQAAILFDPDLDGDLEDKLFEVVRKPALRSFYISAGKEWVKQFSWNKTADQTFQIYKTVGC